MPIEYVDFDTARAKDGLRMVVVPGVPSPWGEAAKGILHVKQIPWLAVRLDQGSQEMADWTGERSGPVAIYRNEAPRSGWAAILLLCERLAPSPALLPTDPEERALTIGLCHEICGEMGLGWCGRLHGVHAGLSGGDGFPEGVAQYLGAKYGYRAEQAEVYRDRVAGIIEMLGRRLQAQSQSGSRFYVGSSITAVDIYSATFMALIDPLPHEQCPMPDAMRKAFGNSDPEVVNALDPILLEHRDAIYGEFLELPLSL
jgi:glutathione S-transferase